ncbi:MerR family transcriptional regulator [Clostridium lacusfryxellense]|uniref:MerR family transcriptional regulator n=1 Tax=Clostridium lacusfryxellense TaxID=205328 RepID=UPI001C0C3A8B|nr:MerR family transcriptional regulator [Clostridium lacusfryxellense]MBU3112980.1 MerR family transcriptional regulator [Clostridium lacusfryxellense]
MEYTVQKLGQIAGISTRTLRYYDEIGILKPARINSSGYRIYGQVEVDRLQQILFYRELDMNLDSIKDIVMHPLFDAAKALKDHRNKLLRKKDQLDLLISNIDKTIDLAEGRNSMTDIEKFNGFKQKLVDDNEKKYGAEIRGKYGDEEIDKSNNKVKGMSKSQMDEAERLATEIMKVISDAFKTGNPAGELAQRAAELHKQWICMYWDTYTKKAHAGLAQMYVDDERFTAYYDAKQVGTAMFLRDAVLVYTGDEKQDNY